MKKYNRKFISGIVVSDKMNKTIVVLVKTPFSHKMYKKIIFKKKKYYVHDENNIAKVGDLVVFIKNKPISKLKHWLLKYII